MQLMIKVSKVGRLQHDNLKTVAIGAEEETLQQCSQD